MDNFVTCNYSNTFSRFGTIFLCPLIFTNGAMNEVGILPVIPEQLERTPLALSIGVTDPPDITNAFSGKLPCIPLQL